MDEITTTIKGMRGYRMGNANFNIICNAVDAVLIAESEDDVQMVLYKFKNTCKQHNVMIISTAETKAMTIAATPVRCKLVVTNEIVDQVMKVRYLGVMITNYGSLEEEVKCQITGY